MSALAAATLIRPLEFGFTPADFCPFKPEPTLIRDLVPPCKGLSGSERLVRIRAAEKGDSEASMMATAWRRPPRKCGCIVSETIVAIQHRLPTMFIFKPYVEAGGLMSYR